MSVNMTGLKKRFLTVAALFVTCVAFGAADAPTITSRIEPDSVMIGDRFTYIIDV